MLKPHGADALLPLYVADDSKRCILLEESKQLTQVVVSSSTAANLVMLAGGYFTPLAGLMNKDDALSVAASMRTEAGLFFPVPVLNLLPQMEAQVGDRIALLDPNIDGNPVIAIQTVSQIDRWSEDELNTVAEQVFGTTDLQHPGVAAFLAQGSVSLAGEIEVLNYSYFATEFANTFQTAVEIRAEIEALGWNKVVAFQTRNPMHRAHEELCKMAMQDTQADGCIVHMLLGKLKAGDIPAHVRDTAIRTMVEHYFEDNTMMVSGYGFDMLYAGPREAVLHALIRQNMGASHLIVGRDHAGVGDYYGAFDAQAIFDDPMLDNALDIEIYRADHTAYSTKLNKVVMMRDVPDHTPEDFVLLSGTRVREMLSEGTLPPPEFSRPEVAQVLMNYYQSL